ncbi:MAG: sigma-54-dependent transcriptional regulator [Hyphomicrobiaceae bacterium]
MPQILVVDDEIGIRELLSEILRDEGYDVTAAENAAAARAARNTQRPDMVLLDIWMPDTDGITLLKEWSAGGQLTMPVIMMSGHGTIDTAVEATKIGALDFLEKPIAMQKLLAAVKRALQKAPSAVAAELTLAAFPRSSALRDLKKRLEQVVAKSRIVLLKTHLGGIPELCARTLQPQGRAFIDLSAAGQPFDLSMLEQSSGGLLYVPELGYLARMQQKNLAFAAERLERFNLRVVAATVHTAEELVAAGWDEPLLLRLFEVWLAAPALVQLKEDVPDIASQLLIHMVESGVVPLKRFSTAALNVLRNHPWPGGYGELKAVVRSLALAALDEEIAGEDVAKLVGAVPPAALALPLDLPLREAREAFERLYFEYHLRQDNGNMTRLAEKTGLERTHLYRKLKQLGLHGGRRADSSVEG